MIAASVGSAVKHSRHKDVEWRGIGEQVGRISTKPRQLTHITIEAQLNCAHASCSMQKLIAQAASYVGCRAAYGCMPAVPEFSSRKVVAPGMSATLLLKDGCTSCVKYSNQKAMICRAGPA
jgi:hypothetical protein